MVDDPEDFVNAALDLLARAVGDRDSALRTLQFATVSPEARPGLRCVILRAFERPDPARPPVLEFHTDRAAGKGRELAFSSNAALLAWSEAEKLQIRLDGTAIVHANDDLARARWSELSDRARAAYSYAPTPGTTIDDPDAPPRTASDDERFGRFAVIRFQTTLVDILRLTGETGQTRATRAATPGARARFVIP